VVAAGLIHNVYGAGDFGDGRHGITSKRREQIRRSVGPEIEEYVARFRTLNWVKLKRHNPNSFDPVDRACLLILMADHLEHLCDLELLYYDERVRRRYLHNCKFAVEVAQSFDLSSLAVELAEGIHKTETLQILVDLPVERITEAAFVIPPNSQQERLAVKFHKVVAYPRQRLRQSIHKPLNGCGEFVKRIKSSAQVGLHGIIQPVRNQRRRVRYLQTTSKVFESLFCEAARLERIVSGFRFTEGPVWISEEQSLLFSDIPANRILRVKPDKVVENYRQPSDNSNGLTRDKKGRLIACEQGNRRVSRTDADGSITVLAEKFQGRKLNSPNDVVVKSDGAIYFTDPSYGIKVDQQEQPVEGVYRISADGERLSLVCADFARPNGLAFSPDEKLLYVDDSKRLHIRAFKVEDDGSLSGGSVFHDMNISTPGSPDGMKVDQEGRLYCTGAGGVWVFEPDGKHLGTIVVPEKPSNCAWGDSDWCSLYITARTSVYRIRVTTPGVPVP
jgi:gluconolactonase